jgi:hypothetical protein
MKTLICRLALALTLVAAAGAQALRTPPSLIPVHDLSIRSDAFDALQTLARKYHVVIGVYGVHSTRSPGGPRYLSRTEHSATSSMQLWRGARSLSGRK